jgi:hypothetical protein
MPWYEYTFPRLDAKRKTVYWRTESQLLQTAYVHVDIESAKRFVKNSKRRDVDLYVLYISATADGRVTILLE